MQTGHKSNVRVTFEAEVEVQAGNAEQGRITVQQSFGCSNPVWRGSVHPLDVSIDRVGAFAKESTA